MMIWLSDLPVRESLLSHEFPKKSEIQCAFSEREEYKNIFKSKKYKSKYSFAFLWKLTNLPKIYLYRSFHEKDFSILGMNQLIIQTPSEQFWLALEWDNIFDMQASMENWFQWHYQDTSLRVFWKEQFERKRRMQDQEVYTDEKEYLHMEYEWFCIYGNN